MSKVTPYQPALLRILHGAAALLTTLALATGYWVYDTYDKRWGTLALPRINDIQGIHGTIALTFLLLLPIFALYSFHLGYRRLVQEQTLSQLQQFNRPVWWTSLQRLANTSILFAVTFAVITGRMMKEEWLPAGEIDRQWYLAHLVSWVYVFISLILHLLISVKVGGIPLLLSMFKTRVRSGDMPKSWFQGIKAPRGLLRVIEVFVVGGIMLSFVMPIFHS